MRYEEWFEEHARKHKEIVDLLEGKSKSEIIDYFEYENMRRLHQDFCPLYAKGIKCHEVDSLNCYQCGCVFFRYCDDGIEEEDGLICFSSCAINAKKGRRLIVGGAIHQDCSMCDIHHRRSVIEKYFEKDWKRMMENSRKC